MKKTGGLKIVIVFFLVSPLFFLGIVVAHEKFDALVSGMTTYLPKLESMKVTGDKKTKLDGLINGIRAFTHAAPSAQVPVATVQKPVEKKQKADDHDDDELFIDQEASVAAEVPVTVVPVADNTTLNDQDGEDNLISPSSSTKINSSPLSSLKNNTTQDHDGFKIVGAYLKAKDAFALANKKDPSFISPFAGAADKAARKAYIDAKAALVEPEAAYKAWLAQAKVTDADFIKVKTQISASLQTLAQDIVKAKKDNPLMAFTDKQKANRAIYDEATMKSDIRKALVKELEKKK